MHDKTHIDWQAEANGYRQKYLKLLRAVEEVLLLIHLDNVSTCEGLPDAIQSACVDILLADASISEDIEELGRGT